MTNITVTLADVREILRRLLCGVKHGGHMRIGCSVYDALWIHRLIDLVDEELSDADDSEKEVVYTAWCDANQREVVHDTTFDKAHQVAEIKKARKSIAYDTIDEMLTNASLIDRWCIKRVLKHF